MLFKKSMKDNQKWNAAHALLAGEPPNAGAPTAARHAGATDALTRAKTMMMGNNAPGRGAPMCVSVIAARSSFPETIEGVF
jgi:hypothetical protein|mmetsp:Transcript_13948/g.58695  ORF Transcript_13948/g.58695 Transcript_13948/m.58695 type:complete len:81 (+) Transcript_13948:934-1176(+)